MAAEVQVGDLGKAPIIPLVLIMAGGYLAWFGVHFWRDTKQTWPSDPVKSVLQGKGIPARAPGPTTTEILTSAETQAATSSGNSKGFAAPQGTSNAGGHAALSEASKAYGWNTGTQWAALAYVEMAEAGFNPRARNSSSGALGLAQALGHGNANTAGTLGNEYGGFGLTDQQAREANSGNAHWQAVWMVNYIKSRWGTPSAAAANERSQHWY